ncbi:hypothetical protein DM01DRAFT_1337544 [Hesseltinella vesiculosa]|uniref:Nuclear pore complex protein Nup85 n=1 Tax=Hesseltinella vesiculosa TaxID=101127 RepID=A0A1X2GD33_9FUNG|nr:hypothetical protein DM01DRAFT_1337544 [Hesseltinella vesiculosa]
MHAIWSLYELVSHPNSKSYGEQLMTWINTIDKRTLLEYDTQGVFNASAPLHHPSFWPLAYRLALRGKLDALGALLKATYQKQALDYTSAGLRHIALVIESHHQPSWTTAIHSAMSHLQVQANNGQALGLLSIFQGTYSSLLPFVPSHLDTIVAMVYYSPSAPTHTLDDVCQLAQSVLAPTMNHTDPLVTLLQGDMYTTLQICAGSLDPWLCAHLIDMMDRQHHQPTSVPPIYLYLGRHGQLPDMESRVYFNSVYAKHLCDKAPEQLWQQALHYLTTCGRTGQSQVASLIHQVPLNDPDVAVALSDHCALNGLFDLRQHVLEKMAMKLEQQERYDEALPLYVRSDSQDAIDDMCKSLFYKYSTRRVLPPMDPSLFNDCHGPTARFYFDFYTMHDHFKNGQSQAAAEQFWKMMALESPPLEFMPMVLVEGMIFVETMPVAPAKTAIDQVRHYLDQSLDLKNGPGLDLLKRYLASPEDPNDPSDQIHQLHSIYTHLLSIASSS